VNNVSDSEYNPEDTGPVGGRRRELPAVPDEQAPGNVADWTLKDAPEARALLASLAGRS